MKYHSILPFIATSSANCILVFVHQISVAFPSNVVVCFPALLSNFLTWFAKSCETSVWCLDDVTRPNEILHCGSLLLHDLSAVVVHTFEHGVLNRGLVRSQSSVIILRPQRQFSFNIDLVWLMLSERLWFSIFNKVFDKASPTYYLFVPSPSMRKHGILIVPYGACRRLLPKEISFHYVKKVSSVLGLVGPINCK